MSTPSSTASIKRPITHDGNGQSTKKSRGDFVEKLYCLINLCDDQYPDIAHWTADGEGFSIRDVCGFESKFIPQFFDSTKFPSFRRRLNAYGFHFTKTRTRTDDNDVVDFYKHPHFQRSRPDLLNTFHIRSKCKVQNDYASDSNIIIQELQKKIQVLEELVSQLMNKVSKQEVEQECTTKRLNAIEHKVSESLSINNALKEEKGHIEDTLATENKYLLDKIKEVRKIVDSSDSKESKKENINNLGLSHFQRLFVFITICDKDHREVAHWGRDGLSFYINKQSFEKEITLLFLKQNNFDSFRRQLTRYNFKYIKKTDKLYIQKDGFIIYKHGHEKFHRDKPGLLANITVEANKIQNKKDAKEKKVDQGRRDLSIKSRGVENGQDVDNEMEIGEKETSFPVSEINIEPISVTRLTAVEENSEEMSATGWSNIINTFDTDNDSVDMNISIFSLPSFSLCSISSTNRDSSNGASNTNNTIPTSFVEISGVKNDIAATERIKASRGLGGIDAIVENMKNHVEDSKVQEEGCKELYTLAFNNGVNQEEINCAGGINAIVRAMRNHDKYSRVQEYGCHAFGNLSGNDINREKIRSLGGIGDIVTAMNNHRKDARVQEYGCFAFCNLSCNDANREEIIRLGGINAIEKAMNNHKGDRNVQEAGNKALIYHEVNNGVNSEKNNSLGGIDSNLRDTSANAA